MKVLSRIKYACLILLVLRAEDTYERFISLKNEVKYEAENEWTVIGAGPAGIITIGVLCDLGIPAENITWIDPLFNVGRLGEYYENVPGNTKTKSFIDFLKSCKTFQQIESAAMEKLYTMPPDSYEKLSVIIEPLQDITNYLCKIVKPIKTTMDSLFFDEGVWHIGYQNKTFTTRHVVLATGSYPRTLDYSVKDVIPLDYALDERLLHQMVKPVDTIAVVGSAHSAILILKYLTETTVEKIINLYTRPLIYAVDMGTWTLNNTHGLKGIAAKWAYEVLENNTPSNLVRYLNTAENRAAFLPECNKIVYAIGYERNDLPSVAINGVASDIEFDPDTGIIGPRIFGIGIAFPGTYIDPSGNKEQLVGLNSFMKYAQKVIPDWILTSKDILKFQQEQMRVLSLFEDLFVIQLL